MPEADTRRKRAVAAVGYSDATERQEQAVFELADRIRRMSGDES